MDEFFLHLSSIILICLGVAVALSLALMVYLYFRNRSQRRGDADRADVFAIDLESEMKAELRAADEARNQTVGTSETGTGAGAATLSKR